jgi:GNAT superfamily N-acetyltransferase
MTPRRGTPGDRAAVVATLSRAFVQDPVLRWLFPDAAEYPAKAAAFFGGLFDLRVDGGEVWVMEGAAALWEPPGGNRLPLSLRQRLWDAAAAAFDGDASARLERHEALVARLLPADRGWYLGVLGVDPAFRGRGLGRAIVQPVLEVADRDQVPVTLETATPANLRFYRGLGFEVSAEEGHAQGPHVWAMTRCPSPKR